MEIPNISPVNANSFSYSVIGVITCKMTLNFRYYCYSLVLSCSRTYMVLFSMFACLANILYQKRNVVSPPWGFIWVNPLDPASDPYTPLSKLSFSVEGYIFHFYTSCAQNNTIHFSKAFILEWQSNFWHMLLLLVNNQQNAVQKCFLPGEATEDCAGVHSGFDSFKRSSWWAVKHSK